MWVRNKDKSEIINLDRAESVFISDAGKMVRIWASVQSDSKMFELGEYSDEIIARVALGQLFDAISDGKWCIEMPSEKEVQDHRCFKLHPLDHRI